MDAHLQMIARLTECTLATVGHLSTRKAPPKNELKRQIGIAEEGLVYLRSYPACDLWGCPRVGEILHKHWTAEDYSNDIRSFKV